MITFSYGFSYGFSYNLPISPDHRPHRGRRSGAFSDRKQTRSRHAIEIPRFDQLGMAGVLAVT